MLFAEETMPSADDKEDDFNECEDETETGIDIPHGVPSEQVIPIAFLDLVPVVHGSEPAMRMSGRHINVTCELDHGVHKPAGLRQHQADEAVSPVDIARQDTNEDEEEGSEEQDAVGCESCGVGLEKHSECLLMRHIINMPFDERMGVEDVSNKHTDSASECEDMPCEAVFRRVQPSAGRLIDSAEKARSETNADDHFSQSVKSEFERRCGVEEAQYCCNTGDTNQPPVIVAEVPYDKSAEDSESEEYDDSRAELSDRSGAVTKVRVLVGEGFFALFTEFLTVVKQLIMPVKIIIEEVTSQMDETDSDDGQESQPP